MKLPQIDSESYKNYKVIANAKRIQYNNLCRKNSNDQKTVWNIVYKIVNPDKKNLVVPSKLKNLVGSCNF